MPRKRPYIGLGKIGMKFFTKNSHLRACDLGELGSWQQLTARAASHDANSEGEIDT
jgi:hypothetical protein